MAAIYDMRTGRQAAASTKLLTTVGEALYGELWQSALARDLGMPLRTMQRWASGEYPPAPGIWTPLRELLLSRQNTMDALVETLNKRIEED